MDNVSEPAAFRLQDPRYEAARQRLLAKYRTSREYCEVFTRLMAEQFPELTRVPGYYFTPDGLASHGEHWWLETPAGEIVDPTADQFPSQGRGRYVRYDPQVHRTVKGKCMNCGFPLVSRKGSYPCSAACDEDLAKEYGLRLAGGPYEMDMDIQCDADLPQKYGLPLPALS